MFINLSIKRTAFTPVWICAALFLSCSNDYNPFTDPSNASVIVKHKSFRDIDTIGIFTTETLKVAVSARDLVDSFSIAATNNPLFFFTIKSAHHPAGRFHFLPVLCRYRLAEGNNRYIQEKR
jgi:hypothetical protein